MPKKVLFIHRSVGHNLLKHGKVYELLEPYKNTVDFSDYDHNSGILTSETSKRKLGYVFPGGNTYPNNLARLFGESTAETKPILDWIGTYDAVILKSCYPTSKIKSDAELAEKKRNYEQIAAYFHKTGQQLGLLTPPPLRPILTNAQQAARARELSKWLVATDFGPDVKVFDLFDLLTEPEGQRHANTLQRSYRRFLFFDAHPNRKANKIVAPKFVEFILSFQ